MEMDLEKLIGPEKEEGEMEPVEVPDDAEEVGRILSAAGMPSKVIQDVLGGWEGEWPFAWDSRVTWSCLITGREYGTGKTHAASRLFLEEVFRRRRPIYYLDGNGEEQLLRVDYPGRWVSFHDFVVASRDAVGSVEGLLPSRSLSAVGVLLMDDVNLNRLTPFLTELLDFILGERHLGGLPTIITSNAGSPEEFEAIDGRVVSRLAQGEAFVLDGGRWKDWRRQGWA